ncbi:hypothetical protein GCM10009828_009770 [Actinoplanes couchii]
MPDVIAQWVRVSWTKQSRGAPASTRRNSLPTVFPLPDLHGPLPHGSLSHGLIPHGAIPDGPLSHGPIPDGPIPDGPIPDGPLSRGSLPGGPLPHGSLLRGLLLHEIDMREWQDFAPRVSITGDPEQDWLHESGGSLHVRLVPASGGNPARWYRRETVQLPPGRWMRWRVNYRFSSRWSDDGFYRFDTLNLAYRTTGFTGPPAHDLDERARLP